MPPIQWQRTLGGNLDDILYDLVPTSDGGYIAIGRTESGISGDKTVAKRGATDIWIVKLNAQGALDWQKTIGGAMNDHAANIIQTTDGGYALGGFSTGGITGDRTSPAKGFVDYWIVKLTQAGDILWQKTYGGITNANQAYTFIQTIDGGFLLGGMSNALKGSPGDKSEDPRAGSFDYWMIKTDQDGNLKWDKTLGGDEWDQMYAAATTIDGGYFVAGWARSGISADKTEVNFGQQDIWVQKLTGDGTLEWQKTFGGNEDEYPSRLLQQTSDGGYIVGGYSGAGVSGNKTVTSQGEDDFWLLKLGTSGNIAWQKAFGGSGSDQLAYGYQTADNGYLLAGHSTSGISGDKTVASRGGSDWWIVKTDAAGIIDWQWVLGGSGNDFISVLRPTSDGGYIIGGYSNSGISGDKSETGRGSMDFWIVKLGPLPLKVGYTACKGAVNKAWVTLAESDKSNYTYTWYNATGEQLQVLTGDKGDTLFNIAPGSYSVIVKSSFAEDLRLPFEIIPASYKLSFTTGILCEKAGVTFNNTSNGDLTTYRWDFGDGVISSENSPSHTYRKAGTYQVLLTATATSGCSDVMDSGIVVHTVPVITFDQGPEGFCIGDTISMNAKYSEGIAAYYWNFDDGTTATATDPLKVFKEPGTHIVKHSVTSYEGCVSGTTTHEVVLYDLPAINAGPDLVATKGNPVTLQGRDDSNNTLAVLWEPATGLSDAHLLRPLATLAQSQLFYLTASSEQGCVARDSMWVRVFDEIKVPNAFSPNGDGINDVWSIPGLASYQDVNVEIFNRWGQTVFKSTGYAQSWNGKIKGKDLPVGTYIYIIKYNNNAKPLTGSITILR